jgi:hypothetical protein
MNWQFTYRSSTSELGNSCGPVLLQQTIKKTARRGTAFPFWRFLSARQISIEIGNWGQLLVPTAPSKLYDLG